MNTGVISSRYARALLRYVQQTGHGEQVCAQVQTLLRDGMKAPVELEPEIQRIVALLVRNGRMDCVRQIFNTFVRMYHQSEGLVSAKLVTVKPEPALRDRVQALLETQTGHKVILQTSVDPSIIGGFILEVGDYMMDASVSRQIELIRRQFIIDSNRIV